MIFTTSSVSHLGLATGDFTLKRFSDGEIYVRIDSEVKGKDVWVVGSTNPPADNAFELFFLLDALKRSGARLSLLIPYFGYARQDAPSERECFAGKLMCDWIRKFNPVNFVLDMHSRRLKRFLDYRNIIPYEMFRPILQEFDCVVAPDKGRALVAEEFASLTKKQLVLMQKCRPEHEKVVHEFHAVVKGKRCIITDDMISTGGTVVSAAEQLFSAGAKSVSVAATHGVFSGDALSKIRKSGIDAVYVTDSLPQRKSKILEVLDVTPLLKEVLYG